MKPHIVSKVIIATTTPGIQCRKRAPRKQVMVEEIAAVGHIDTCIYKGSSADNVQLLYIELKDLKVTYAAANLDLL